MGTRLKLLKDWIGQRLPGRKAPPPPPTPRPDLWPKVQAILEQHTHLPRKDITPTAHLVDDLALDSLDSVELVMSVEEEFGIEIPDEEAEKLTTVPELLQYPEGRLRDAKRSDRG